MSMTRRKRMQFAEKYFAMGLDFLEMEFNRDAAHYFRRSIKMYPTAEAYTYLGWSLALLGDFDQAIEFCKIAISLDPDYGNPYNDIGAYLLEKGEIDEAIPYLRRAVKSRRYDPRYFAHFNLGRAFEKKYAFDKAFSEYRRALELNPKYRPARDAYYKILRMMN
jgi:Tfp pilus assembly protein PilF